MLAAAALSHIRPTPYTPLLLLFLKQSQTRAFIPANLMVQTRRSTRAAAAPAPAPAPAPLPSSITLTSSDSHLLAESSKRRRADHSNELESESGTAVVATKKPARKKQKKLKTEDGHGEASTEGFPVRISNPWKIGAHVSAAGGVENAVRNAAMVGASAFALFVKSQRKWDSPPFSTENVDAFKRRMQEFRYSSKHVLPHGSYLVNLGNPDEEKRQKSFNCFLDDLQRCEQLGLELYNFHPGSTVGQATKDESIALIAECINNAHKATKYITIVIENMAGSGNVIGSQFSELYEIIDLVDDKARVGVCLDTCHMFAAGYNISTKDGWNATLSAFDTEVGLSYLKGMHLNDSKAGLGSKKDRHENIGLGHIGISTFRHIVSDPRTQDIPLILETPTFEATEIWAKEIAALNSLSMVDDGEVTETVTEKELSLVGEITSLVRSHAANKAGKASKTKTSMGRARKRDVTEDQDHDSDCA
ncbi:xylose isomerase-like protein [Suillus clintonianus]|uniref:xylose isomerase-like protein n=1 Tax=Suillus clintonianus TaxID=1904413 RepID=UPI001B85EACF|nr:xylose isomerase-like protein [Suillus clintonianus]KAG2121936.1 xylose isomerase-like protein [Suillus clintonianus]